LRFTRISATLGNRKNSPFLEALQGSEKNDKTIFAGDPMSENLNLLRQNYCRPGSFTGKRTDHLFPLEEECEEGKTLLATAPKPLLDFQEFDPHGLEQTYREEATGAELPVFAVFDLEGSHQLAFEITVDSLPATDQPKSLSASIPFQLTQVFVQKINDRRMKAEGTLARFSVLLGVFPVLGLLLSHSITMVREAVPFVLVGGWVLGAFFTYLLGLLVLNQVCPWKKLVLTAEFNGILPKETREKARAAKEHFDKLYLIVDQHHRWKSVLLPDPSPRVLDPLLIGELQQDSVRKYYLIDQFDLTEAEQYLADEFATGPTNLLPTPQPPELMRRIATE
jgi:hypothetical protein